MAVDVEEGFLPWLMDRVEEQMNKHVLGRTVMDSIIREVVLSRLQAYNKLEEQARQEQLSRDASQAAVDPEPASGAPETQAPEPQPQAPEVSVEQMYLGC